MKKRIAILAAAALCVSVLQCFIITATPTADGIWTDYAAAEFAGGTGTEADPYRISTAEQLAKLAKDVNSGILDLNHNGKSFVLTNDIDLQGHRWFPIGTGTTQSSHHSFYGRFDGKGFAIKNLYVDESADGFAAGLFGNFGGSAVGTVSLQNLNITDAYVTSKQAQLDPDILDGVGILIGNAAPGYGLEITVKNCKVQGTVTTDTTYPNQCGGLVGSNSYALYENCEADVNVIGRGYSGGFVGNDFFGKYSNCTVKGSVSGFNSVGGFAGLIFSNSNLTKCISYANVTGANWHVGGFVGYAETSMINSCVALGNVESTLKFSSLRTGGFVGSNVESEIEKCHFAGKLKSAEGANIGSLGGFVGYDFDGTVLGCSFSSELNPEINAVAELSDVPGTNTVSGTKTATVNENICTDFYGSHNYNNEFTVDKAPSCTEKGSKSRHCTRCDAKSDITEIPADGHSYSNEFTVDKEPTCTEKGSKSRHCEKCDSKTDITEIPAAHTDVKHIEASPASETAEGNIEYWFCEDCSKYYTDEALTKEISKADTVLAKLPPQKGDSEKEDTGDAPLTALYISLGAVVVALIGVTVYRRKFK